MINDSTNVRVIADNIKKLEKMVKEAGSELPTPGAGDTGKILKVGSDGYELATEYSYTPPAYSTTETDTGQKWIDGKNIYSKTFIIPEDDEATSPATKTISLLDLSIDEIIYFKGITCRKDNDGSIIYDLSDQYTSSDHSQFRIVRKSNFDVNYVLTFSTGNFGGGHFTLYYTKATPAPEPTTSTKKTTKKG